MIINDSCHKAKDIFQISFTDFEKDTLCANTNTNEKKYQYKW